MTKPPRFALERSLSDVDEVPAVRARRTRFGLGALLLVGAVLALSTAGAGRAISRSYDDEVGDSPGAPDIVGGSFVTNDNVSITIGMRVGNRSGFSPLDWYSIAVDADSSPGTGGGSDYGVVGADYVIDVSERGAMLMFWNGSAYELESPQPVIPTIWIAGYGPALRIARAAVGNPKTFALVLRATDGAGVDLAPDTGAWSYTVVPLRLTAGRVAVRSARRGATLVAETEILRSDFGAPLVEGAVTCNAWTAGRTLAGRGRFVHGLAVCTWRLPRGAHGLRVRGGVGATFQGATARRGFRVHVR
jgi:hypothetical protein